MLLDPQAVHHLTPEPAVRVAEYFKRGGLLQSIGRAAPLDCTLYREYGLVFMIKAVVVARSAMKDLRTVPRHVAKKLQLWVRSVERLSLEETRKQPGWHDEPLKGQRAGQRSIRLSLQWRAIYTVKKDKVEFALVEEVNPHKY